MPVVEVKLFAGRSPEQKRALAEAIAIALVELADAKPDTINVLFHEFERIDWVKGADVLAERADEGGERG